jgi:hypothetical protein
MRASSRSQAIITTRHEIDKSAVTQILQLLPYFWFDVPVAGIKFSEMPLERVDVLKHEVALAACIAWHFRKTGFIAGSGRLASASHSEI